MLLMGSTAQANRLFDLFNSYRAAPPAIEVDQQRNQLEKIEIQKLRRQAREIRLNFGNIHLIAHGPEKAWYQPMRQNSVDWEVQLSTKLKIKNSITLHLVQAEQLSTRKIVRLASFSEQVNAQDLELVKKVLLEANSKSEVIVNPDVDHITDWVSGSVTCKTAIK